MKKLILVMLALIYCVLGMAALVKAQGIELGVGVGVPISSRDITTEAVVDSFGIVRTARVLDSGPQILVEFHKTFKAGQMGIGPMIGFVPKIDFGTVTNAETEQPVGAGVGLLVKIPSKSKQHFNVGVLWVITAPVSKVDAAWQNGFQAPRGVSGIPLPPQFTRSSVNRLMLVTTISGLF